MMRLIRLELVFLALYGFTVTASQNAEEITPRGDGMKCLTRFEKYQTEFRQCQDEVCFLFLQEEPYIDVQGSLSSETDQKLFPCRNPTATFPRLRGSVFNIHRASNVKDALCVWGGSGCTFDDLTAFLTLRSRTHPNYQFAATGMLLESPSRVSKTLYPSISILDSQLVIVGPVEDLDANSYPFHMLIRPFRLEGWILFLAMIFVIAFFGLLIIFVFMPDRFRWHTLFFHFMGEPVQNESHTGPTVSTRSSMDPAISSGSTWLRAASQLHRLREVRESNNAMNNDRDLEDFDDSQCDVGRYKASMWLFRGALSFLFIIFILFYEIAVVNFMIEERSVVVPNLERLSAGELSKYVVLESSGIEDIWRKIVDPYRIYNDASMFPWHRCNSSSDCFDKVLDKRHSARYTVTFDHFARYGILKRKVCHKLTIYSTERGLYSFGAGWLFGKGVRNETRLQINEEILQLRVTDDMRTLMDFGLGGRAKCETKASRIGANIIGVAVLVPVGPALLFLTAILFSANHKRAR